MKPLSARQQRKQRKALAKRAKLIGHASVAWISGSLYVGLCWGEGVLKEIVGVAAYERQPVRFDKPEEIDGVRLVRNVDDIVFEGVSHDDTNGCFVTDSPLIRRDKLHRQNAASRVLASGGSEVLGRPSSLRRTIYFPKGALVIEV